MDVDEDARVGVLVGTRQEDSAWVSTAAASDSDLVAGWIKLGSVESASDV